VVSERPTLQVSSEDTFASDLLLSELEGEIRRLAAKTWQAWARERQQRPERVARTVVLKLKTADFRVLTRSLTPDRPPASEEELADTACALRERVELPSRTRYRLVGVGLSGIVDESALALQEDLFAG
jgi:DNA polymerase-4